MARKSHCHWRIWEDRMARLNINGKPVRSLPLKNLKLAA